MTATPKITGKKTPQMCCLGIPFFPIACLISQMNKKGNIFTSKFSATVNGFHWNSNYWFTDSAALADFMIAYIRDSTQFPCRSMDIFSHFYGNSTESDLSLYPCLRSFKPADQLLGKTEKTSQTTLNRRGIQGMEVLCQVHYHCYRDKSTNQSFSVRCSNKTNANGRRYSLAEEAEWTCEVSGCIWAPSILDSSDWTQIFQPRCLYHSRLFLKSIQRNRYF